MRKRKAGVCCKMSVHMSPHIICVFLYIILVAFLYKHTYFRYGAQISTGIKCGVFFLFSAFCRISFVFCFLNERELKRVFVRTKKDQRELPRSVHVTIRRARIKRNQRLYNRVGENSALCRNPVRSSKNKSKREREARTPKPNKSFAHGSRLKWIFATFSIPFVI